jgi:hypothetical protein
MKQVMALVSCASVFVSGCATVSGGGSAMSVAPRDAAVIASYVRSLPVGSPVRVGLTGGRTLHGTLMRADESVLVVQPKGRIPEPPREVPLAEVVSVDIHRPSGLGKVIAIGAAAGAAATVGVLMVLWAVLGDD